MTGKSIVHIFVPRFCFPLFIDGGSRNLKSRQPPTHLSRWPVEFPKTTEPALRAPKPSPSLFPMCVIMSFIIHHLGWQATGFWAIGSEMALHGNLRSSASCFGVLERGHRRGHQAQTQRGRVRRSNPRSGVQNSTQTREHSGQRAPMSHGSVTNHERMIRSSAQNLPVQENVNQPELRYNVGDYRISYVWCDRFTTGPPIIMQGR